MTVVVIGAGVIGLSTAYALHRAGETVTVIERNPGPGEATSFANAGGLCPSFAGPWAAPGMMRKAVKWLFAPSAPLKIRPTADLRQWRWLAAFARECDARRSADNKRAMQTIAHYSHARLGELLSETGLVFDHGTSGILQTFRSRDALAGARRASAVLTEMGIKHSLLDSAEISQVEPALARSRLSFEGALHFPADGTGDAHAYCRAMAGWLADAGVCFLYQTEATGFATRNDRLSGVRTGSEVVAADAAVLTTGPFAPELAPEVPVYPVKGYSLTYYSVDPAVGPRSSIMDEDSKIMFTRLGSRLRVGGVAELAGYDRTLRPAQIDGMTTVTGAFFPEVSNLKPRPWSSFRPMTPDGRPRIGPSAKLPGLWLNLGHGSNGWTQAAGAGQLTSDLVTGRKPGIDPAPYAPAA